MKSKKRGLFMIQFLMVLLLGAEVALANKASVSNEAPAEITKGSEITIRLTITDSVDNLFHRVEWGQPILNNNEIGW